MSRTELAIIGIILACIFGLVATVASDIDNGNSTGRFTVEVHVSCGRRFMLVTDTKTGVEYLAISECGIIQLTEE